VTGVVGSGSIQVVPAQVSYTPGSSVTLTAVPDDACHEFVEWSGDAGGSTNPLVIAMDANKNITATFAVKTYTIAASAGSGGAISPSGDVVVNCGEDQGFTITSDACYDIADVVVDGVPQGPIGSYLFEDLDADHTIAASFAIKTYTLTTGVGGNGYLVIDPDQPTYDCGTEVEIAAHADLGWAFDRWTGDAAGSDNPLTVVMNANKSITGIFIPAAGPSVADVHIANLSPPTDDYAKNHDDLELTATVTDNLGLQASDILADLSDLLDGGDTAVPAETYVGDIATWSAVLEDVALTDDGSKIVTITATNGYGLQGVGSDAIIVDNTLPGFVEGFSSAPGYQQVHLSWSDAVGEDANYGGVLVRYDAWGDYPTYDTPAPGYPSSPTAGDGEAFTGTGDGATHAITAPDIYYYSAFVYDMALNYGPVTSVGQARATNYWLGDVANGIDSWEPDGSVTVNDINKLAGQYGSGSPWPEHFDWCDVGPTDDQSRLGVPLPDEFLDFEDLIIFAMNYGEVAPRVVPFLSEPAHEALALSLVEMRVTPTGEVDVAMRLDGNVGEVKGLSAEVAFDRSQLEFVSARLSDEMLSPLAEVFFWCGSEPGRAQVDLAVLGTGVTIGGSGEVVVLTFRALGGGYALEFGEVLLRGAENEDLAAALEGLESLPAAPTAFRLSQNVPNPFNPETTVTYEVPQASEVTIRVYDVTGKLVRTLVEGAVEPGRYVASWDGTNDVGESVGSGVYFCVMDAPAYHAAEKMVLLK
jgi:hypothetical protein